MLAVNTSGGCGKTRLLKLLVKYAFLLQLADKDHVAPQYWLLSPLNQNLDHIVRQVYNELLEVWEKSEHKEHYLPPIVIHCYMKETDQYVMFWDTKVEQANAGMDTVMLYFRRAAALHNACIRSDDKDDRESKHSPSRDDDAANDSASLPSAHDPADDLEADNQDDLDEDKFIAELTTSYIGLMTSSIIMTSFATSGTNGFDRRLQEEDLSEGTWALRRAGVRNADNMKYPIAEPNDAKWGNF
jgi:hypothetical protein